MIKAQIDNDLKEAMGHKDQVKVSALRMLKARLHNEEIAKQKEFGDQEVVEIIGSEVKRRRDSVQAYTAGNRPELALKEEQEIAILQKYLPAQLSEAEVRAIMEQELSGKGFMAQDFGKAMGLVMPKLKGKTEGGIVSKILKEILK